MKTNLLHVMVDVEDGHVESERQQEEGDHT